MGKRFKQVYPDIIESNYDFTDNGKGISHREVVDLLNSLSEKQRITNMTNQALIKFIKSIGYSLEEVLEFVNEL